MERDELIKRLTGWIEPGVIAKALIEAIEESEQPLTLKACKDLWLSFLEHSMAGIFEGLAQYEE